MFNFNKNTSTSGAGSDSPGWIMQALDYKPQAKRLAPRLIYLSRLGYL